MAHGRWIAKALAELNPQEQTIIREWRLSKESLTLEALGRRLGISKERIRQIEQEALRKLRVLILTQINDPVSSGLAVT